MENNKDLGKLALKAGIWYVISNVMVKAVGVITTPIFTRLMTTEEYGTVQTFTSWYVLLLPIFTLNLNYSVGRAKLDFPGKLDEYMGSMVTLGTLFSFGLSILAILLIQPLSRLLELTPVESFMLLAYLSFQVITTMHLSAFRYRFQYKHSIGIAWYSILSTTLISVTLILTVKGNKGDLRMLGLTIPTVVLALFFYARAILNGRLCIRGEYWKYGLKISLPLIVHTISMHILSQSDRVFITKIWGKSDTAFYSLAYTYGVLLHVFKTAASDGWLPWFHETYYAGRYDDIRKNVKPMVVLACYIGLASVSLAPEAIHILGGTKYAHSIPCVAPVVLGVVCQYIYTHYVNIELHLKKTTYVSAGTIVAAVFNIVTNAIFIPRFGFVAAAYTTLASYFLLMLIHFAITRKVFGVHLYDDWFMFGAMAVTAAITGILTTTYDNNILRYFLIGVGFLSFLFYFRNYIRKGLLRKHR